MNEITSRFLSEIIDICNKSAEAHTLSEIVGILNGIDAEKISSILRTQSFNVIRDNSSPKDHSDLIFYEQAKELYSYCLRSHAGSYVLPIKYHIDVPYSRFYDFEHKPHKMYFYSNPNQLRKRFSEGKRKLDGIKVDLESFICNLFKDYPIQELSIAGSYSRCLSGQGNFVFYNDGNKKTFISDLDVGLRLDKEKHPDIADKFIFVDFMNSRIAVDVKINPFIYPVDIRRLLSVSL